ncbi:MAG: hypothetical protein U0452_01080 [Anaerolineae bacterium]
MFQKVGKLLKDPSSAGNAKDPQGPTHGEEQGWSPPARELTIEIGMVELAVIYKW